MIYFLYEWKKIWIYIEPDFISNEIAWNIGRKAGITESESKSKSYQKFVIDKIEYSESEINSIIQKMNMNDDDKNKLYLELDSKDIIIEGIKYQLNPKLRLRRKIKIKNLLKLGPGRKKKLTLQTQIIINILQII